MKLIFIHGRDQQAKDPDKLKNEWIEAFKKGLSKNGLELQDKIKIEFPFYGDILNDLVTGADDTDDVVTKGGLGNDAAVYYQLVNELKDNAEISDEQISNVFEGEAIEKGPLNWAWVQAILQVLDKTRFGKASIKAFTYDVFLYLTKPGVRKAVDSTVSVCFTQERCVVVGHSLGSIVGYNVLSKHTHSVSKYITVGSPLGLVSVKNQLAVPLKMPSCIGDGWFNAYDERDVVALNALDSKYFNITPSITNKSDVKNWTDNRHGIEGYLDDRIVSKAIYEALTE